MRRKNDILWKGLLEEVFDDLLRFIFPDADQVFDIPRGFEFLDKELAEINPEPEKETDTRFVDKLVKVYRNDGQEEWLLCHVEIQGQRDLQFPERMFRYYYRIFDRYKKPITAIAIFTGQDGGHMPDSYEYMFLGTHLVYTFNTLRILNYSEESLLASDNPFALVALTARKALLAGKIPEKDLLEQKLLVAKALLRSNKFARRKVEMILVFLKNYILFEKSDTNRNFVEAIDTITGKKNTMGLIEQIQQLKYQEAREEGSDTARRHFVENLLLNTDFPPEKIADLADVTVVFVKEVKDSLRS